MLEVPLAFSISHGWVGGHVIDASPSFGSPLRIELLDDFVHGRRFRFQQPGTRDIPDGATPNLQDFDPIALARPNMLALREQKPVFFANTSSRMGKVKGGKRQL